MGVPDIEVFKKTITMNTIKNCPITIKDINVMKTIYKIKVAVMKGKGTRKRPSKVVNDEIEIPKELYLNNPQVDLCINVMYVEKMAFLTAINKTIRY